MSNITQLKDKDGNNIYPISSDKLILDENGKSIREKVDEHLNNHPQGFSGDYNDLTNKPNIPTTEGLATEVYVDERFADIVNSAPEALDTLKELSDALGNDPNFATTVATQIGTKADSSYVNSELSKKSDIHEHPYKSSSYVPSWNEVTGKPSTYTPSSHIHNEYIKYELLNGSVSVPDITILDIG